MRSSRHKTVRSPFNSRVNCTHTVYINQLKYGTLLEAIYIFCVCSETFTNPINHRKAPQSANISELQPRHTPTSVTNCLAICTGLYISLSFFLTDFDHTDPRVWHLLQQSCSAKIMRVFFLFVCFFVLTIEWNKHMKYESLSFGRLFLKGHTCSFTSVLCHC